MDGTRRFVWQLIAAFGYLGVFLLVGGIAQLTWTEALIPAALLVAYAVSAQLFPEPWRYVLAAGPWLLILSWFVYLAEGSLDCGGDCEGASVGTLLLVVTAIGFVGVIVAGPVAAIQRWRSRRR